MKPDQPKCKVCNDTRAVIEDGIRVSNCPWCCYGWVANGTCCWVSVDSPGDHDEECTEYNASESP